MSIPKNVQFSPWIRPWNQMSLPVSKSLWIRPWNQILYLSPSLWIRATNQMFFNLFLIPESAPGRGFLTCRYRGETAEEN